MFLLPRNQLPATPQELQAAIEEALRRFCSRTEPMVTVRGCNLPNLEQIAVNLSGASIDPRHRAKFAESRHCEPALFVRDFSVLGEPVTIFGSPLTFQLVARDVELDQTKGSDGGIFLMLHQAASGEIRLTIEQRELEQLITQAAAVAAKKHGVTIDSVVLKLNHRGPRTVDASVRVSARKLLFRAVIELCGSVAVSNDFVATISNLRCAGDGNIAALACAAITPHFQRLEKRPLPLSALPIGEVQLRDVALLSENESIVLSAQFGSSSATMA